MTKGRTTVTESRLKMTEVARRPRSSDYASPREDETIMNTHIVLDDEVADDLQNGWKLLVAAD